MFSCRAAWQRCGPLARRAAPRAPRHVVQRRPMSSVPGGSGENVVYALLCGGALVGAVSYAVNLVSSDNTRFNERIAQLQARPRVEWVPKPWPPKGEDDEEGEEEGGEAVEEVAAEEAETVEETAAQVAVEVAEEVQQEVEEVAQEVQQEVEAAAQAAEEVAAVAEAAEEATQDAVAEEPESNGTTSPAEEEEEEAASEA